MNMPPGTPGRYRSFSTWPTWSRVVFRWFNLFKRAEVVFFRSAIVQRLSPTRTLYDAAFAERTGSATSPAADLVLAMVPAAVLAADAADATADASVRIGGSLSWCNTATWKCAGCFSSVASTTPRASRPISEVRKQVIHLQPGPWKSTAIPVV